MAYEEFSGLTGKIIGCAIAVHKEIGPGFSEIVYARALRVDLEKNGIVFVTEWPIALFYDGKMVGMHRLDLLVADSVIVELKAVKMLTGIHIAQMLSYLKSSKKHLGLLLNFSTPTLV